MRSFLGFIAAVMVAGCTTPYLPPKVNLPSSHFVGMVESLQAPSNKKHIIDVVLVHGMCTTDINWIKSNIEDLMKVFGQDITVDLNSIQLVATFDGQTQLYQYIHPVDGGVVRIQAILWSPATIPAKTKALCYDEKNKSTICNNTATYPYKRALGNGYVKDVLLDDCLADVVFYAGDRRSALQKQFQEALPLIMGVGSTDKSPESLASYAEGEKTPLFFVTESLGSKITFDSLLLLSKDKISTNAVKQTIARTVEVFMAANQLPILSLTSDYTKQQAGLANQTNSNDSLDTLYRSYESENSSRLKQLFPNNSRKPDLLTIIPFSDPNDLFSYPLKGSDIEKNARYQITDVIVSNDWTWVGVFENPWPAHTSYLENKDVRKYIACGYPISDFCAMSVK